MKTEVFYLFLCFASLSAQPAHAFTRDRATSVFQGGMIFYGGSRTKSLSGAYGFLGAFKAQPKKGVFRPTLGLQFDYSTGYAHIGSSTPSFDLFGGGALLGFQIHPFVEGRVMPFVNVEGYGGWRLLRLGTALSGVDQNTNGVAYGFHLSAGVDLRFWSTQGNAIRLESGYWFVLSHLAGQSGFELHGFRATLGFTFAP